MRLERIGVLDVNGVKAKIIGDVHLGRRFITGVPLHRRGDREKMVMEQFERELRSVGDAQLCVQVGDIFDKFVVSNEVLDFAARTIHLAADANPRCSFVFIRGNHDAQRDLEKVSSFDILHSLCIDLPNVFFINDKPGYLPIGKDVEIGFCPWHPIRSAEDIAKELVDNYAPVTGGFDVVIGHWDLKAFGDDTHNLIPSNVLDRHTNLIVTGHDHRPRQDGNVICIGSMQPYAFGEEDPTAADAMYMDLTLLALQQIKIDLSQKCVRVWLNPGEALPSDIDCLQLTARRTTSTGEDDDLQVELGEFDMDALFRQAFEDEGVDEAVTAEIFGKFKEARVG